MKVRKWTSALLVLLLLLSLTACGGTSKAPMAENAAGSDQLYNESPKAEADYEYGVTTDSVQSSAAQLPADRKLIRTVNMEAETEDLSALLSALEEKLTALNGYVQAREVYNGSIYSGRRYRHADMTLRIPSESLNSFVAHVEENANVVTSNETIDDVTTQYVDTESHIAALEIEQERLLELLSKADTMEDILTIEKRLTNVRYELENYTSQLRVLDNKVTYATVHIYITEVQEYTPVIEEEPTTWERIRDGFTGSIEEITEGVKEFFVWFLVNSPFLVIWGLLILAAVLVLRKRFKKRPVKSHPRQEDKPE